MVCAVTSPLRSSYQGSPNLCWFRREKCVDFVEGNISRKNNIMQDVRLSNCCAIAYVILFQKIWRALVYMNLIDSHRRVDEGVTVGNCRMNRLLCSLRTNWHYMRGSFQQGLQHAFDLFYSACDQAGTKISTKKTELLCFSRRPKQCTACFHDNKPGLILIFTPKFTLGLIFGRCLILIYQKMELQSKN